MKYLVAVIALVLACAACAPSDGTSVTGPNGVAPTPSLSGPTPWPQTNSSPKVYVLMHIWYRSGISNYPKNGDPIFDWSSWRWGDKLDDPRLAIPGAPWLRQISSNAYPLIGPYDSRNPEVIRWQFRQMKEAGIDGAFIPVYSWALGLEYTFDLFFGPGGVLQIAYEENFQVALEQCGLMDELHTEYAKAYEDEVIRQINAVEASPFKDAYIRLDDRLLYWIPFPGWMSADRKIAFLDRNVNWIFRNVDPDAVVSLNQPGRLAHAKTQLVSDFDLPGLHGWELMPYFKESIEFSSARRNLGMHPIASAYVGFDERMGVMPRGAHPGRYGLRYGVSQMASYLEQSRNYGTDIAIIESWNEWGECSTIEAGINIEPWRNMGQEPGLYLDEQNNDAPFKYQDVIRQFKGKQQRKSSLSPPCSIVDPLILQNGPPWLLNLINCTQ